MKISHFYFEVVSTHLRPDNGITLIYHSNESNFLGRMNFQPDETFPLGSPFSTFEMGEKYIVGYTLDNGHIKYIYADKVNVLESLK